jgi:hypothetical protein
VRVATALLATAAVLAPNVARAQSGRARVLIVSGVAGEPQYADVFFKQATTMIDALKTRFGVPDSDIVYLAENPSRGATRIRAHPRRRTSSEAERARRTLQDGRRPVRDVDRPREW